MLWDSNFTFKCYQKTLLSFCFAVSVDCHIPSPGSLSQTQESYLFILLSIKVWMERRKCLLMSLESSPSAFRWSFVQTQKVQLTLSELFFFSRIVVKMTNLILFGDPGSSFKVLNVHSLRQILMWNALDIEGSDWSFSWQRCCTSWGCVSQKILFMNLIQ